MKFTSIVISLKIIEKVQSIYKFYFMQKVMSLGFDLAAPLIVIMHVRLRK